MARPRPRPRECSASTTTPSTGGSSATGRAAGQGFPNGAAVAVQANRPPSPNPSSTRSSRWSATRPRDQLGLAGWLWTREAVAELIGQRHGLLLARTTVGGYLRGWGCSPQRPQRRALEQHPAAVRRWLVETYPAIRARAKREGGVVLWLDELGIRSDAAAGRSWAPVGQTPVIKRTGKRFRVNMLSAVSNAGRLRFRLFTGSFTGAVFIDFLGRLLRDCGGRKVHLIVDGHPVHRAKAVSAWVGRHTDRIELHVLAGYSPELQPGGVAEPCRQGECWGPAPAPLGSRASQWAAWVSAASPATASGPGPLLPSPHDPLCRPS
jgi:hypothetical protein